MGRFTKNMAAKLSPTMPQMNKRPMIDSKKDIKKKKLASSPLMKAFGK